MTRPTRAALISLVLFTCIPGGAGAQSRFKALTNNQPLKDSVSALLPVVQLRGIRTAAFDSALSQSGFHREGADTSGGLMRATDSGPCGLTPGEGLTFLPTVARFTVNCGNIYSLDSSTHTILNTSDVDQLIARAYRAGGGAVPAGAEFFSLATSSSTVLHELTHAMIYRTRCFSGPVNAEETLVGLLEALQRDRVAGAKTTFYASNYAAAQAAGGTTCMETLGIFDPIARFTMTFGAQSAIETQTLNATAALLPLTISVDTSRSFDFQGTVISGQLRVDGVAVSNFSGTPSIPVSLSMGTHVITLQVYNSSGFQSQPVQGTVLVSQGQTLTTFNESFTTAPNYTNNWTVAAQYGTPVATYTPGNFRIQSEATCGTGTNLVLRSKLAFTGDVDVSFQLNHGGFGRTVVGLWSTMQNQAVIQSILDTNDTAYLNFGSGPNFTEYTFSSAPYMNRWITLRIRIVGSQVMFYADDGSGPALLKTWPLTVNAPPDSYSLFFAASSICWKSGANDTSFRQITATGTSAGITPASVFVTSANANSTFRYNWPAGNFTQKFDNASAVYAYGGLFAPDGYFYLATTDATSGTNSHVDRYDPVSGVRLASFGALPQTRGMTLGPDGLLYVIALNTHEVWRYNPVTGAFIDVFAATTSPYALAFGPDGNLYIASAGIAGGNTVKKVNMSTRAMSTFVNDPGLDISHAMIFGPDNNLYLGTSAGVFSSQVRRYNGTTGAFDRVFANMPNSDQATALTFGADGRLYVGTVNSGVLRMDGTTGALIDTFIPSGSGGLGINITGIVFY